MKFSKQFLEKVMKNCVELQIILEKIAARGNFGNIWVALENLYRNVSKLIPALDSLKKLEKNEKKSGKPEVLLSKIFRK